MKAKVGRRILCTLGAGECFGERSLVLGSKATRGVCITAKGDDPLIVLVLSAAGLRGSRALQPWCAELSGYLNKAVLPSAASAGVDAVVAGKLEPEIVLRLRPPIPTTDAPSSAPESAERAPEASGQPTKSTTRRHSV